MTEAEVFQVDDDEEDEAPVDLDHELPAFASAENRQLNQAVIDEEKRLLSQREAARESKERVVIMKEHLKNVIQEIGHTEVMLTAKSSEVSTESHLKQLAERELGRIRNENRQLDGKASDVREQLNAMQSSIFKGSEKLEKFKLAMSFNQSELEQWALAAKQKEDDVIAIESYERADESRVKELSLSLERLTTALAERKRELERETTETQAKQIELDKSAEEFRQLHRERQQLVRQWKDALDTVQSRDQEIADAGNKYAGAQEAYRGKKDALAEQGRQLQQMRDENAEFVGKIEARTRVLAKQRQEYQAANEKLTQFADEVDVLRNTLQKAASDVVVGRSLSASLTAGVEDKTRALDNARAKHTAAARKMELSLAQADKVEASAAMRESELAEEEGKHATAQADIVALKEALYKQNTALFQYRRQETAMISEIAGSQAASRNLAAKIHKLDSESGRQQELLYTAEFQIQQLERKVSRASGERSDDEKVALTAQIAGLNTELETAAEKEKLLLQQTKVLRDDLRRVQRQKVDLVEQLSAVTAKATETLLQSKATEEALRVATREKEEVMVGHDVLKLEVRKLRAVLSGKANSVFGLENHRQQLEMSVLERRKEVAVHIEVQRAQVRLCEEERHRVAMDLKDRAAKIAVLQAKHATICARMKSPDNEEGAGERSQAYFVIKAAQKREELQREGDGLDAKIRKLEREVKALMATLDGLNSMNTQYRVSQTKADFSSEDGDKLRRLQSQSTAAADILFRKKRDLQQAATDVEQETSRASQLNAACSSTRAHMQHLRNSQAQAESEVAGVLADLRKANSQLHAAADAHRRFAGVDADTPTADEIAFAVQARSDTHANVLFTLAQLVKEFPEMQPTLFGQMQEKGLKLPQRPPSRTGI